MADPIAEVLGKDMAYVIYKCAHQITLKQLNTEYHMRLKDSSPSGEIVFFEPNNDRQEFYSNWREENAGWSDDIAKWAVDSESEIDDCALLPRNYWHIRVLT